MCHSLVRGMYSNITFWHNLDGLRKGIYGLFGKLVAIALVNGCPGPHCFCPLLASYVLHAQQNPSLDEVPRYCEFRAQIKNISESIMKFQDKDELVNTCIK